MDFNAKTLEKSRAKKVLIAYGIGLLALAIAIYTPLHVPCVFKLLTGLACPGCGLSRAFVMASRFDFIGAATINILFLPLVVGAAIYFICAILDAFAGKSAITRFNSIFAHKWVIVLASLLMCVSWYYNIIRGI